MRPSPPPHTLSLSLSLSLFSQVSGFMEGKENETHALNNILYLQSAVCWNVTQ